MFNNLPHEVVDIGIRNATAKRFAETNIRLPKLSELADPVGYNESRRTELELVDPHIADPRNLFRVHWHNTLLHRGITNTPEYTVLNKEITGVDSKIIVALGNRFPMIKAHKVLPAYGCLVPRLISGQFNPIEHRAVWPSTGNYCRGGIAISRILGCRGVAVLPEGMSRERFDWLHQWVSDDGDIVRTAGTESNVKEIYDACHEMAQDPTNVILNQFSEFGNYIVHRAVTGPALEKIFHNACENGALNACAYISASGSAGTLAAGDYLKQTLGTMTCVVEASECPTLLYNGYGEHNIQGIGDKHLPLIHNVMDTDFVIGVSDKACDALNMVFNTPAGHQYMKNYRYIDETIAAGLTDLGLSSIANILAAIKLSKYMGYGPNDAILTIATDGAEMYGSELEKSIHSKGPFTEVAAGQHFGQYLLGAATDHVLECTKRTRDRIFNLGYYTWVEQQGISIEDFEKRRERTFWDELMMLVPIWDNLIDEFNHHGMQ